MARYLPGPDFVKLSYTRLGSRQHTMTIPIWVVGTAPQNTFNPGNDVVIQAKRNGTPMRLSEWMAEFVDALKPLFNGDTVFSTWTHYHQEQPTSEPTWVNSGNVTNGAGASPDPANNCGMTTFTFRTSAGGLFKLVLMEAAMAANTTFPGGAFATNGSTAPIWNLIKHNEGETVVHARDNSGILGCIRGLSKTSDSLRKRYLI